MLRRILICLFLSSAGLTALHAQALPAASRFGEVQVGILGSSYTLDYGDGREKGFTLFADLDLTKHLGVEASYVNASIITPHDIGESGFFVGPRYRYRFGRFVPYVKGVAGISYLKKEQGFNANGTTAGQSASSESYFSYALGGGLDIRATKHIVVRAIDYQYEKWPNFPPHGLTPTGFSAGLAYTF